MDNNQEAEITSATLAATSRDVSLVVGKEYSDGYATLKMTSATAGTITSADGLNISVTIINGELVGTHEDFTFKYKLIAGDSNTITLAQVDTQWKDVMNGDDDRQGPPGFWSLTSSSEAPDLLPASGSITLYNYDNINHYGDYDAVKFTINFDNHTLTGYAIDGTQNSEIIPFTVSNDGKTMIIGDSNNNVEMTLMSKANGAYVFNRTEHSSYNYSAQGYTNINDYIAAQDDYVWAYDSNNDKVYEVYMKLIRDTGGNVIKVEYKDVDGSTETYDANITNNTLNVIYGNGEEGHYTISNNRVVVNETWQENIMMSTTQLIDYGYNIVDSNGTMVSSGLGDNGSYHDDNNAPVTNDLAATATEDTKISGTLKATDIDKDTISFALDADAKHGIATVSSTGAYTYTPTANFNGTDSFTYLVRDDKGGVDTATVTINVTPVNDIPVIAASTIALSTNEDTTISGKASATDADGDTLAFAIKTKPAHGTVTIDSQTGDYVYTPAANYNGADSFVYSVSDGHGGTVTATIKLTVNSVNDNPDAQDLIATVKEDAKLSGTLKATDIDKDTISFALDADAKHGTVTIDPKGKYTYTPTANFNGSDSFTYSVNDGKGGVDTATVTINVTPVNDKPAIDIASNNILTQIDSSINGQLLNSDIDGDTLTYKSTTKPSHGTIVLNADGSYVYTPTSGYFGNDSFSYSVNDGHGGTVTAKANIIVTGTENADIMNDISKLGNSLYGLAGDDTINGGAGNDILNGGLGNDTLDGGVGIDTVTFINATSSVKVDLSIIASQDTGDGMDTITNIENLTGSSYDDTLMGNVSSNTINGEAGNDTIYGGLGNDILSGGIGNDSFVFDSVLGKTNIDKILDFDASSDLVLLDNSVFSKLIDGTLSADNFASNNNGKAMDADDYMIYNTSNGNLSYDADGNGSGAAIVFATLSNKPTDIIYSDFMVI